ncbi:MAG: glycine cleavage system protein GcvH [Leptospiraceae bacterium]|nr:glycine cleavage system protein GcvH [Leptospiraceae bacterium]MCK6380380.1 glycine cleavage system protein GcvH [Leptospiraceae bacterium]NUM41309.1 glycine cleavage system protein GcvH [Leptospiraceae bacterium]
MSDAKVSEGLKYTKKHEWVKVEGEIAILGISDYAQSALGDIVFIDLPKVGKKLKAKDSFGTIESVKAADDLYSPISGEVSEINSTLTSDPSAINKDAYSAWMIKIVNFQSEELSGLLSSSEYREYIKDLE